MTEPHIPVNIARLSCPICRRLLRDPATIPCGHNFCLQCIKLFWDLDKTDFRCPECCKKFPYRPPLIRNTTLAEMVKDAERNEGRKRTEEHSGGSLLKRHRSSAETSDRILCRRHQSPLEVYCCTEEQIICAQCASAEHKGHKIGTVRLERSRKQEELKNIQAKLRRILQEQERNHKKREEMSEQIEEAVRQTEDHCESVIVQVIECLQKHYLSVKEMIGAQAEAAAAQLNVSLQKNWTKMEEMKRLDAELDHLAQNENDMQFLQNWPSVRSLCDEDHLQASNAGSEELLSPLKVTKRAVEELGRQLEEFCDKEFPSICHTSDREKQQQPDEEERSEDGRPQSSGWAEVKRILGEKTKEPKTREEFLQYACDLSLDPTTAHKDLIISDGDKEVMLSPDKGKTPVERSPQRFVQRRQVLCREGLQKERCYYEVKVEGEKAEIALTYKGIDRKSNSKKSAFGGNANSWSLDLSKSYSVSHDDDSILLTAQPCAKRVGVYLKFKEGTLSFYEVLNQTMMFLYKVEAKFTEPLYPGFWLGDKCGIRICNLKR